MSNGAELAKEPLAGGAFLATDVLSAAFLAGEEGKLADASSSSGSGEEKYELVRFEETPKMSTYLAVWAVGRFR